MRPWRGGLIIVPLCIATCMIGANAAAAADPDWPCMVIEVPHLALASAWSGPSVDRYLASWPADPALADLARRVSERRMPPEEAAREIHAFAGAAGTQRHDRLLELMAGVFTTLAAERDAVMAGLDRFGRRQKELAGEIRTDVETLRTAQAAPDAKPATLTAMQQKVTWETRMFEQRRDALHYACDVPTLIEQRLFVLARIVEPLLN